jgi:trimeric autotransporter adhesin
MMNFRILFSNALRTCLIIAVFFGLVLPVRSGLAAVSNLPEKVPTPFPGDIGWHSGFYTNGLNDTSYAVALDQNKIYVGGNFTVAGNTIANRVAMWDGASWQALGSGMDAVVYALTVDGRGRLYAGERFSTAGGKLVNGIARWDGVEWKALGSGVPNGYVCAIAIDSANNVYVGGLFNAIGDIEAHGIARWDGSGWHALGNGMFATNPKTGMVSALAIDRFGFLYAGGTFSSASGGPANYVARWDGEQWSGLGAGINAETYDTGVFALAADHRGNLYAGGHFITAGETSVSNLARWNGENWSAVGGNATAIANADSVSTVLVDGGNLYVGGNLKSAGGILVKGIALWKDSSWQDLGGGFSPGDVKNLTMDRDGKLIAVGRFITAGDVSANHIAVWDGVKWSGLGKDQSVNSLVLASVLDRQGGIYVGGSFAAAAGLMVNHIAHWDGTSWNGLGDGLSGGTDAIVSALALDQDGFLYAAGRFNQAGSLTVNNIAKWAGSGWEALGDGINGYIKALAVDSENNLYVGGLFDRAGNVPVNNVAKWTGTQWEALDSGVDHTVLSLAIDDEDRLIASGDFEMAGDVQALGLARWNGDTWVSLTDPYRYFRGSVLLYRQGTLYLGCYGSVWTLQNGDFHLLGYFYLSDQTIPSPKLG